ncbi:hypothetical protein CAPTEDRAFT_209195 [Capitella teleta]|uniref:Uncharacterized protein n=1 Tax=Capitella teleta TaxID=283909 RepID=R7VJ25_CAPTE|nr:hypothetical protein CAPTEDRAFT_209195 [Capitella teleta]|eukprot:ELU18639.1 hypothetical protein CAPTEDRAFT_209195 [Capitella teleta]
MQWRTQSYKKRRTKAQRTMEIPSVYSPRLSLATTCVQYNTDYRETALMAQKAIDQSANKDMQLFTSCNYVQQSPGTASHGSLMTPEFAELRGAAPSNQTHRTLAYRNSEWNSMLSGYPRPERGPEGEHLLAINAYLPSDCIAVVMVMEPGHLDPKSEPAEKSPSLVISHHVDREATVEQL